MTRSSWIQTTCLDWTMQPLRWRQLQNNGLRIKIYHNYFPDFQNDLHAHVLLLASNNRHKLIYSFSANFQVTQVGSKLNFVPLITEVTTNISWDIRGAQSSRFISKYLRFWKALLTWVGMNGLMWYGLFPIYLAFLHFDINGCTLRGKEGIQFNTKMYFNTLHDIFYTSYFTYEYVYNKQN